MKSMRQREEGKKYGGNVQNLFYTPILRGGPYEAEGGLRVPKGDCGDQGAADSHGKPQRATSGHKQPQAASKCHDRPQTAMGASKMECGRLW
jgi:hypothetical protein